MHAVVQRVLEARVIVDGRTVSEIARGFLVLVGVGTDDVQADAGTFARKIAGLRVFEDADAKMNLALADVGGRVLAMSQFTLWRDCRKGRRPSFIDAARPETAKPLFDRFVDAVRSEGIACETGVFGADMHVELVNDGPVTLLIDARACGGRAFSARSRMSTLRYSSAGGISSTLISPISTAASRRSDTGTPFMPSCKNSDSRRSCRSWA